MPSNNSNTADQKPAIVWFRDDLRLADHPALNAAVASGNPVLAIYILDEVSDGIRSMGAAQKWFLHHALLGLSYGLKSFGSRLDVFEGSSTEIIRRLAAETGASAIYWNRRCGEAELAIDAGLKSALHKNGLTVKSFQGNLLHEPYSLKTGSDGPYRVYSPFWRAITSQGEPREPMQAPDKIGSATCPDGTIGIDDLRLLPSRPNWAKGWEEVWQADEKGAAKMLETFLDEGLNGYATGRDFPSKQHVSRLSPFLRFGLISPYQIWHATRHAQAAERVNAKDAEKFLKEIAWREFSHHLLFHFPYLGKKNHQEKFDSFPWKWANDDPKVENDLTAWKKGQTGYPIVDAGMRELWQTGYMHNRVRMIVASFLVKHLLIHWQEGEKWFWDTLIDGDPANNTASWQWVAGSGADAAPYFRVFNPIIQGKKFDTKGDYVRTYVPELANLPDKHLHAPWEAPEDVLKEADITLGQSYPRPIIEHSRGRERALAAFEELKKAD